MRVDRLRFTPVGPEAAEQAAAHHDAAAQAVDAEGQSADQEGER